MISIWNFLGRVGGGYFSEIIVRCVFEVAKWVTGRVETGHF